MNEQHAWISSTVVPSWPEIICVLKLKQNSQVDFNLPYTSIAHQLHIPAQKEPKLNPCSKNESAHWDRTRKMCHFRRILLLYHTTYCSWFWSSRFYRRIFSVGLTAKKRCITLARPVYTVILEKVKSTNITEACHVCHYFPSYRFNFIKWPNSVVRKR